MKLGAPSIIVGKNTGEEALKAAFTLEHFWENNAILTTVLEWSLY